MYSFGFALVVNLFIILIFDKPKNILKNIYIQPSFIHHTEYVWFAPYFLGIKQLQDKHLKLCP